MGDRDDAHDPDAVETDPNALSSSEGLDEDRMQLDPLEAGVEPPEHWTAVDRFGMTHFEQQQRESLEERVQEEQPDVQPAEVPERPVAATPADQLDESIDDPARAVDDTDREVPSDATDELSSYAVAEGRAADEAGGSVAEAIRTPPEPE
ncbi:hypothetical protein [Amycolatopsis palatopharyngis]|uniref:hypothetical protein n=1 Tax=Amycolatopsis palatopharyngis TaxID=187982 RepID=UPI001B8845B5|nr:hypothetical protein [Amycolatopsis palatopharyngis]